MVFRARLHARRQMPWQAIRGKWMKAGCWLVVQEQEQKQKQEQEHEGCQQHRADFFQARGEVEDVHGIKERNHQKGDQQSCVEAQEEMTTLPRSSPIHPPPDEIKEGRPHFASMTLH
ncbi:uncharacterized protein LOC133663719 isoform X2 [Entelurus aequoreus]|uniref:uncharacterized protein LOC133663719 isoform X2 n=1 Tax=Entelurus aequoreus TaxID=161455 RepID=UPI002B1E8051|nr:uncharacterized protein LOC133663719 isoform X2 [Entelurus aequoreus]